MSRWIFFGKGLVHVHREPPLPGPVFMAVQSLVGELEGSRAAMEDFLEVWREHKYKNDPDDALVGDHCEIHIVGDRVHLYPLYDEQWGDVEDVWIPLADVEEMFREYAAWAFGGS